MRFDISVVRRNPQHKSLITLVAGKILKSLSRMRNLFLVFAIILIISDANAQSANISGRIMDKTAGTPLPGVSVQVDKSTTATTSDGEGNYSLAVPMGKHVIHYTMVGMKPQ